MRIAPLLAALLLTSLSAAAAEPITLTQAMADPDWIGPPVEDAWWRWDGQAAQYLLKREGASIRDRWQVGIDGGAAIRIDGAALADLDSAEAVFDAASTRSAFVRNGDVFVRDLRSGALTQLTRTVDLESRPQWSRDGGLVWKTGDAWYRWDGRIVAQAALLKAEDAPGKPPKADDLRERQLRLIDTLRDDRARREAARKQDDAWRAADSTRAPEPIWLGKDVDIADSALSPDGRWLLVAITEKGADKGTDGKMPKYVTESGYEEFEDVRTRVGRTNPLPHKLWLADISTGKLSELAYDALPGIKEDPLAAMRKAAGKDPLKGNRALQVGNLQWSSDSNHVAVMLRAVDNKDRWIAGVDLANATLQSRHRLHDDAWINRG
ncbi:MAG: S9 family peptidase, partial [Pseudomonadota bacterium]|nr:S9 family peptidase [Pseudomonadota bacterium]